MLLPFGNPYASTRRQPWAAATPFCCRKRRWYFAAVAAVLLLMYLVSNWAATAAGLTFHAVAWTSSLHEAVRHTNENGTDFCRMLVVSDRQYHYEVLESVMMDFPEAGFADRGDCDLSVIVVDFLVVYDFTFASPHSKLNLIGKGWVRYMESTRPTRSSLAGRARRLGFIRPYSLAEVESNEASHIATIFASCSCDEAALRWSSSPSAFCILHNSQAACDPPAELTTTPDGYPRAYYMSPHEGRPFFFPTWLPPRRFPRVRPPPPIQLCVIGHTRRRNFGALSAALSALRPSEDQLALVLLGKGPTPAALVEAGLVPLFVQKHIQSFREFYDEVAQCDVILPLVEPDFPRPAYFAGKLTGSVVQAAAYEIEMVAHEQLELIYHDLLTAPTETYTDEKGSFERALRRMLRRKGLRFGE